MTSAAPASLEHSYDEHIEPGEPQPEASPTQGSKRLQLPQDYRIFYPKKIHAFVENFLSAEPMNVEMFTRWRCQTKPSKDFWIENGDSLIRVRVV